MNKPLLILTACVLSTNVYGYCDYTDHECAVREADRRAERDYQHALQDERDRQRYQDQMQQEQQRTIEINRQREREQWQAEKDEPGARDTLCTFLDCD